MSKKNPANKTELKVGLEETGRLDHFLARHFSDWSRTRLQGFIKEGRVLVDGRAQSANTNLRFGQTVTMEWPGPSASAPKVIREITFPILFEDESLLVVDKPAGLVVHPSGGHHDGNTLVEILNHKISDGPWPDQVRPGLVHRLDRDTSGLILMAKTPPVQTKLSKQFADRLVKKTYLALVEGLMRPAEGSLECYMARHPSRRQRYAISDSGGRWALTSYQVKRTIHEAATLVELTPKTGRTHQLRVQLAGYKHPILGDYVYGQKKDAFSFIERQMLHASEIQFFHPVTGETLHFAAPLPEDFLEVIKRLESFPSA